MEYSKGVLKLKGLSENEKEAFFKTTNYLKNICEKSDVDFSNAISALEKSEDYQGIAEWYYFLVKKYSTDPRTPSKDKGLAEKLLDEMSILLTVT